MVNPTAIIESTRTDRTYGKLLLLLQELKHGPMDRARMKKQRNPHTMPTHPITVVICRLTRRLGGCGGYWSSG